MGLSENPPRNRRVIFRLFLQQGAGFRSRAFFFRPHECKGETVGRIRVALGAALPVVLDRLHPRCLHAPAGLVGKTQQIHRSGIAFFRQGLRQLHRLFVIAALEGSHRSLHR